MVRATRSSAGAANLEPRVSSKKRKRVSNADNDEQPSSKLPKIHSHDPLPSAALSHLHDADATGILDILEVTDSQGLLDRVFPLPSEAPSQGSFSLRTLLKQASQHPLWVLQASVQNLFPLSSSHPRSRPSETAILQHRFCKVALSLLDQASRNAVPVPLTVTSLLDSDLAAASDSPSTDDGSPDIAKDAYVYKRYALLQHLPSGDYWTSLNADIHSSTKQLKDLSMGNAELVAVFPTPSKSDSATSVPLLGSYHTQKVTSTTGQPAGQRRVPSGTFLDYGLWSSFAPSFDHGYQVVGRSELGELLYHRKWEARNHEEDTQLASVVELESERCADSEELQHTDIDAKLDELLPSDLEESLKDALKCLELEKAVDELLEKNRRALRRLDELQRERLSRPDGGSSQVEEESEEWEIAHAILDSLTVLVSLRPKPAETKLESIVPPASVLHSLQRTLIRQPTEGWYGTLPPTRATALRDDATVKVRAGSVASTTPATATATNPVPTTSYAGYTYTYGQQAYRPPAAASSYASYKQGQYYQTPYLATGGQQLGTQNYYGQQAYAGGATGQQPYAAYSAWYSQYSTPGASAPAAASSNAGSGRGTPQPAAPTTGTAPSTYGNFFPASGTPPPGVARSPAVANTVLGNKGGTPGTTWTGYSTGQQQAGYYGAYGSTAR